MWIFTFQMDFQFTSSLLIIKSFPKRGKGGKTFQIAYSRTKWVLSFEMHSVWFFHVIVKRKSNKLSQWTTSCPLPPLIDVWQLQPFLTIMFLEG